MVSNKKCKRVLKMLISAAVVSSLFSLPALANTVASSNGDSVNVRERAGVESQVLGQVNLNDSLELLGMENSFAKIIFEGSEAYVSSEFVTVKKASGSITENNVTVRGNGGLLVLGKVNAGDKFEFTGRAGDMLIFDYNGATGFVHKNFVDSEFKSLLEEVELSELPATYALVNCDGSLNLRESANTDSKILSSLYRGDALDIVEYCGDWLKVQSYDNKVGYIKTEYAEVKSGVKPERPTASSKGVEVVAFAKNYLGTPYSYGGTSLTSGVDCSGFVYSVYKNFGITLNRTSSSMPSNGTKIAKSEMVAGDLMFFSNYGGSNIQHVGIYCGDGTFIHAASGGKMRVMTNGINESYYANNYLMSVRILK